jgi:hypothetical protein
MQYCSRQGYIFVEDLLMLVSLDRGRNGAQIFPTSQMRSRHISNVNDAVSFEWAVFCGYKLYTHLNTWLFRPAVQT